MSNSYEFHQTPVDDYVRSLPPEERRQIMHDFDELQRTNISGGNTAPQGHAGILFASCIARLVSSSCLGTQKVPEPRGAGGHDRGSDLLLGSGLQNGSVTRPKDANQRTAQSAAAWARGFGDDQKRPGS